MRHAFLIIAHNEFRVLSSLVAALDRPSNDIYIHYDKRVKVTPSIQCREAGLYVLENRVKAIWGDVSLAEVELNLLSEALKNGGYDYYHIISGTHFPLKDMDFFDGYFKSAGGANVLMPMETGEGEIEMKMGKNHRFLTHLVDRRKRLRKLYHFLWLANLSFQKNRIKDVSFVTGKASQWCSVNEMSARALVEERKDILRKYHRSFCCDEFFMRSFLETHGLPIVFRNDLCFVDFVNTAPRNLNENDYDMLVSSPFLFARKMTEAHMQLVERLSERL